MFPRASAAESGGVWGSAPSAPLVKQISAEEDLVNCCDVLERSLFLSVGMLFLLQCSLLSAESLRSYFDLMLSRNVTIRVSEEERAAQSGNRVFAQPRARACAVPKFRCLN
jgi:hypothetical protein